MVKQATFYINEIKAREFVDYILSLGGNFITKRDFQIFYDNDYEKIKNEYGNIFTNIHSESFGDIAYEYSINYRGEVYKTFNDTFSEVIEFHNSRIFLDEKRVSRGRICVEMFYYDENGDKIKKSKELDDFYKKLAKWIKKNIPYQEVTTNGYTRKEYITDDIIELINAGKITQLQ